MAGTLEVQGSSLREALIAHTHENGSTLENPFSPRVHLLLLCFVFLLEIHGIEPVKSKKGLLDYWSFYVLLILILGFPTTDK